ncbi:MAG: DUF4293 family protein [Bacteroidetes bacterium]|nr:DUF4293 family protein [Bacteroidota bacterium]MBM3425026.1 DUF4293 family protein [Bacteroidota bacterium]
MLQRVQNLYFGLAIILWSFFFSGASIIKMEHAATKTKEYISIFGCKTFQVIQGKESLVKVTHQPIYVLCGLMITLVFLTLMRYKSPKKQLSLARITLLLNAGLLLALVVWSTYLFASSPATSNNSLSIGYYLLCITVPLSFFGYRGVLRDKMLLDSMDRLR